jgi:peptidyl-prolyl cis-trans isomerase B (cyclophilin B)
MIQRLLPLMLLTVLVGCQKPTPQPIQKPVSTTASAPIPAPAPTPKPAANPVVEIVTSKGTITVELFAKKAPGTVKNFLRYVDEKHYDNLAFHRVIQTFMIQGGGFDVTFANRMAKHPQIQNEADNGVSNARYTIAMARAGAPHSASAQFFINTKDNTNLNHSAKTIRGWGYCAFGKVIGGKQTVDTIAAGAVGPDARGEMSKPIAPVPIKTIQRKL